MDAEREDGIETVSFSQPDCVGVDILPRVIKSTEIQPSLTIVPIFLKFHGVEYMVEGKTKGKHILKGVAGRVCPGEMLALMGPSGSGKTTLLKIVGGRLHENVKGKITYNDIPYTPLLKRRIGFVTQDDELLPQLTVKETLMFSAFLKLPTNLNPKQKHGRVESIIRELGLERCQHTRVGGGGFVKGVSGGERKRTSIGYEILSDPSLLLLDEPTSGLDSNSAIKLVQILHYVAKEGRTIISTIHQPSSRVFHMFDKLLLISEGQSIFYGKAIEAMDHFLSLQFFPQISMNPAEFLLDLATGQMTDIKVPSHLEHVKCNPDNRSIVVKFLQLKYKSDIEPKLKQETKENMNKVTEDIKLSILVKKEWTTSWWEQFKILSKRTYKERRRDYFDKIRACQAIGVAFLLGLLWWKSEFQTEAQLRDQVGLLFYICIFWTSSSIFGAVYVFPFEKTCLVKERKADMYRLSVYYVCSTMCDMLVHMFYPIMFMVIVYFMAGFKRTVVCFFFTLFTILLITMTSQGVGELLGAAILSVKRAGTVASLILMLFLLTGGYYVQHIPKVMRWMKYTSFIYYGFRLLLKVQYSREDSYECDRNGKCKSIQESPSFDTVDLSAGYSEVWFLIAMTLGYRIFAYICLKNRICACDN